MKTPRGPKSSPLAKAVSESRTESFESNSDIFPQPMRKTTVKPNNATEPAATIRNLYWFEK
jgi:hypothetical protein